MDERFRKMVGEDYQKFVDTANIYIYQEDIDNIGATVVSMWVRGAANVRTAIIMYTASDIWAARVEPDANGKLAFSYFSTRAMMWPKCRALWQAGSCASSTNNIIRRTGCITSARSA